MNRSVCLLLHLLVSALISSTAVSSAYAELTADHVAVLANRRSPDSLTLARYYATRRGIPVEHILQLDLPIQESISRKDYEERIVLPVRTALQSRQLTRKVRVLVTTFGIPLRVDAPPSNEAERRWLEDAAERQRFARGYLVQVPEWANRIAPSSSDDTAPPIQKEQSDVVLLEQINKAIRDAIARVNGSASRDPHSTLETRNKELSRIIIQAGGRSSLLRYLKPESETAQQSKTETAQLREQVMIAQAAIRVLMDMPSDTNRKQAYQLTERVFGLEGILRLSTAEIETHGYHNGDASVDSELMLLWWDRSQYAVSGRFPNPFFYGNLTSTNQSSSLPVMLVSRIDAPNLQLAQGMIDRALDTEQRGLIGKAYVDSRGIQPDGTVGYGYYDQGLRDLAGLLRAHSNYPVILEDTERRFSERGQAPDVAVYAGWYKLRSYEDAFTFNPGAIGYHIASGEAVSIHDPNEPGWCKNALERGITVTLGPVGEPYVDAFPLPNEFFGVLLTGRYTLAEAYALTTRYTSWRMVLFGDPLYNPWRGRGLLTEDNTVLRHVRSGQPSASTAPFVLPFNDPVTSRQELRRTKEKALAEAKAFVAEVERQNQRRK